MPQHKEKERERWLQRLHSGDARVPLLLGCDACSENEDEAGEPGAKAQDTKSEPVSFRLGLLFCDLPCHDRLVLITGLVAAAVNGAISAGLAVMMGEMVRISTSFPPEQVLQAVTSLATLMLAICFGSLVSQFSWSSSMSWFAARQTTRLRTKYFESVLTRDISWFDMNQPAALPARMVTDTKMMHAAIGTKVGELVMSLSQAFVHLLVALIWGWELTLVVALVVPVIACLGHFTSQLVKGAGRDNSQCVARAGAVTEESFLGIRTVAAFGGESQEVARLERDLSRAKRAGILAKVYLGLSFGFLLGFFSCSYALAFWYGAHRMISTDRCDPADVIIVCISLIMGAMALGGLEGAVSTVAQAIGATMSMYSVINARPEIEPLTAGGKEQPLEVAVIKTIEFVGVRFSYPSRPEVPILQGLDLRISQGQKVALVGETGSGKSTIVQLLERFYDPPAGMVLVNGMPLRRLSVYGWRRLLGYVGQEPVLFQGSVLDNIRLGSPKLKDEECLEAARRAEVFDFVNSLPLGFGTLVGVGGSHMSGGQKQRISIARALARKPQLLILDEATSALDYTSEKQVQATLDQLQTACCGGLTTLSVAHRLSTVMGSDEIHVFKDGRVVERGSHAELMAARGEYSSLVQAQHVQQQADGSEDQGDDTRIALRQNTPPSLASPLSGEATPAIQRATEASANLRRSACRLISFTKPEWAVYPVFLLSVVLLASQPAVQGLLISRCLTSLSMQPVEDMLAASDKDCLALLALGAFVFLGEVGKHSASGYLQQCLILRLRREAFASMVCQEIGFFDDPSTGTAGLNTALARMMTDVALMMGEAIGNTVQSVLGVLVGIVLGFYGSARLTLVMLAMMPIVASSMIVASAMMTDTLGSGANARADRVAAGAALNIRTLRAFNAEESVRCMFSEAVADVRALEVRSAPRKGLAMSVNSVMVPLLYILNMWYGGRLIAYEGVKPEDVFQTLLCVSFGFTMASLAANYGPVIRAGLKSAADLIRIIDRTPEMDVDHPSRALRNLGDGTIEFQDVSFHFPHRREIHVLQCVNFCMAKGRNVALVGPSGSGKSTIVQLLLRFYDPTCGAIMVGGMNLRCFDLAWWRRRVGLVSQEPVLFDLSLEDNVKYGCPEATRAEVEQAARSANMDYAFNGTVAWADQLGLRGERLSGGQKQRCAIARAMVRCPEVLLLDEPTSALDSVSEHAVQTALERLRRGRTTFTIAHRLGTIKDSDLILVIDSGRIVERGTHDELLALRSWYAEQWLRIES